MNVTRLTPGPPAPHRTEAQEREIVLLAVQTLAAGQAHLAAFCATDLRLSSDRRAFYRDTAQKAEAIERQMRRMVEASRVPTNG